MAQEGQEGEMTADITPKLGDLLEENCSRTDFKARYIVLSIISGDSESRHGNSYELYTLYVESSSAADRSLQGTIDVAYNLEINNHRDTWRIIS